METIDAAVDVSDDAPLPESILQSAQEGAWLYACHDELADNERAALRGAFFDGSTYEELSVRMNVPLGTMKCWIRRAMIKLKSCLEQ
jgi:RNA polymerase sigma-70 factor (ECF subfamily)